MPQSFINKLMINLQHWWHSFKALLTHSGRPVPLWFLQMACSQRGIAPSVVNTLRPRQNGRHFADDIFKCIFLNENVSIAIKISLKFVPKGPINNIPALVQIMAWRRPGDKPLSEPMMVSLPMHICVTRPQWVNPSPPSVASMLQWIGWALVQIMAVAE